MNKTQFEKELRTIMKRCKLIDFRLIAGGDIVLFIRRERSSEISVDKSLWIESAWRICVNNKILGGSLDDENQIIPILRKLQGRFVENVSINECGDLMICFGGGAVIESFVRSFEDEQWELRGREGICIGLGKHMKFFSRRVKKCEMEKLAEDGASLRK